jgi:hypothetical protein
MEARFVQPATTRRPHKSHRFDVHGLKVSRAVTLFNKSPFHTWLDLESTPAVTWYCERPLVIDEAEKPRAVDFYVIRDGREQLWFCLTKAEVESNQPLLERCPGFAHWCEHNNLEVVFVDMTEPVDNVARTNWGHIVRELSAFRRYVSADLVSAIRSELSEPKTIADLWRMFPTVDPIVIKVGVFQLVHQGLATGSELGYLPISPAMTFSAL